MKLNQIIDIIEQKAPLALQESWDNSGWQIHLGNPDISRVLVSLEVNGDVISEAIEKDVQLIVCHHPLIFGGIKSVDSNTVSGNNICRLILNEISVYATHTPFDKCEGGNNDYLASLTGLENIQIIAGDESEICRMGSLKEAVTVRQLMEHLGERTGQDIRNYKLVGHPDQLVHHIGMCTGAGAEFMDQAAAAGCDLFITGDVKYHTAHHAKELGLALLDMGHFGSEQIFTENMAEILRNDADYTIEVLESETDLNPFTIVE